MEGFYYEQPVPIDFGIGKLKKLPEIIDQFGFEKGLLISTPSMVKNGVAAQIVAASNGKLQEIFSDIQPNPTLKNTDDCADILRSNKYDFAVAIGGGSILDCAKVACFVANTEDSTSIYFYKKKTIDHSGIPLIAIPTTSGTASEITAVSVLTDTDKGIKAPLGSKYLYAKYAIIDPELTYSCPPHVTATSGIDVLAHSLEAFYGKKHQPYTDMAAEKAAKLVFENLLTAYKDPNNIEARVNMSLASVTAGFAFNLTQTAAAHACSYPLTQDFGITHGEACAFTLAAFWRLNSQSDDPYVSTRLQDFSKRCGFEDGNVLADFIDFMKKEMDLCMTLEDAGVTSEELLDNLVANSFAPNMQNNPIEMTPSSLKVFYQSLSKSSAVS
ncbi:alcohol dehydrogenase [Ureibacillus massiliensis 4400831 = CIP 108448 = CCUG 49529]|uniref:Alcohol dehydrogenase n=2 Tax=cellular organisms TaxID=131567 RepID=A0A0A3J5T1_9BACL|nr:iron-containing alcohol dehydrogenase family protein [Ureibacillus massiliensis]KGR92261.1 alcohol dehydrogenase [Ureibacillus massiliensis 4400831 = CIP 108448 = CCUG 49529]